MRLNPVKLGLTAGILWGLTLFLVAGLARYTGTGMFWISLWMDLYPGFELTVLGSLLGLVSGFIHGFVSFFIFGWLYNLLKP